MRILTLALIAISFDAFSQENKTKAPETMTKMIVRLMGPGIKPGSFSALLPIVLPLDPRRRLGKLYSVEFGSEYEFFQAAGAAHRAGPVINAKATDAYELKIPSGAATLVTRGGTETPVTLSWQTSEGPYKYEYITYEDMPFDASLFAKPSGIQLKEIPPDPDSAPADK